MKKSKIILSSAVAAALMVSACGKTADNSEQTQSQPSEMVVQSESSAASDTSAEQAADSSAAASATADSSAFFSNYAGTYTSGVATGDITINPDGTFDYIAIDGAAGTKYICSAHGTFGDLIQEDEHTFKLEVTGMTYDHETGDTWDETTDDGNQIHYEAFESGDIMVHDYITFYLAGIETANLPDDYINTYADVYSVDYAEVPAEFPVSGLYNGMGGASYVFNDTADEANDEAAETSESVEETAQ